ncbi:MAG: putative DNA modification/repair radical SAM protein [Candidatus Aenigmatarchaeota archaeon]
MEILDKIRILGDAGKYDTCASSASSRKTKTNDRIGNAAASGICHSFTTNGRCVSLFKTLYSNSCIYDCKYCANSTYAKRTNKTSYTPDQLAKTFMSLYMRNYVEGLFLSSGVVKDPDKTTEDMLSAVQLLREKYKFHGYIHFKVIPGVNKDLIKQASQYTDRMSVNLEAPNKSRLSEISSNKDYKIDIIRRQRWVKDLKLPAGQTTQYVVGGADETDIEILKRTNWEYENVNLRRAYFSVFMPVKNTPLENKNSQPPLREHRLYNIDFMMRTYGMQLKEFETIMDHGMLPKDDPKLALAKQVLTRPVDINSADFDSLIRVPGIGPTTAHRIVHMQKQKQRIMNYETLHRMGVVLKRAKPFIKVDGKTQTSLRSF